jgi:hypothetical protein
VLFNSTPIPQDSAVGLFDHKSTLELLASRGFFPVEERPHNERDRYRFNCPFHADKDPSLSLHANCLAWTCWAGCGQGGPRQMQALLGGDVIPRSLPKAPPPAVKRVKEQPSGCSLRQLSKAKPLPEDLLRSVMGWVDTTWYSVRSVGIPYPNGSLRYRVGLDGKNRFKWRKGSSPSLYWLDHLPEDAEYVLVVEGETDVAAATFLGIPAVGVPGVNTWKSAWAGSIAGENPVLWVEPDQGGESLAAAMAEDIPELRVIEAPPGIKDICELLEQAGDGAADMLRDLIAEAERYYPEESVANKAIQNKSYSPISDKRRERSQLWKAAEEIFPMEPGWKPYLKGALVANSQTGRENWVNFYGRTWRNLANAQHHRQCLYFNLMPRINGPQLYGRWVPFDDWTEKKHRAISRQIGRGIQKSGSSDYGWLWFDNVWGRGYVLYLTDVPGLRGFEPVEDTESVLVDALRAIHPPGREEEGRFRPYGGSDNWTKKAESTGEEDQDVCHVLAVSDAPTDFVRLEAECRVSGVDDRPVHPYWRGQYEDGLETNFGTDAAIQLAIDLGYRLTKRGRSYISESSDDKEGVLEWAKKTESE